MNHKVDYVKTLYMVEGRMREEHHWWPVKPFEDHEEANEYADLMAAARAATGDQSLPYYWRVAEWLAVCAPDGTVLKPATRKE